MTRRLSQAQRNVLDLLGAESETITDLAYALDTTRQRVGLSTTIHQAGVTASFENMTRAGKCPHGCWPSEAAYLRECPTHGQGTAFDRWRSGGEL